MEEADRYIFRRGGSGGRGGVEGTHVVHAVIVKSLIMRPQEDGVRKIRL